MAAAPDLSYAGGRRHAEELLGTFTARDRSWLVSSCRYYARDPHRSRAARAYWLGVARAVREVTS